MINRLFLAIALALSATAPAFAETIDGTLPAPGLSVYVERVGSKTNWGKWVRVDDLRFGISVPGPGTYRFFIHFVNCCGFTQDAIVRLGSAAHVHLNLARFYEQQFQLTVKHRTLSGLTFGPDGSMWFAEYLGNETRLGHLDVAGRLHETSFSPSDGVIWDIRPLPGDGTWFAYNGTITRINSDGVLHSFAIPRFSAHEIIAEPGGVWALDNQAQTAVAHIDAAGRTTVIRIAPKHDEAGSMISDGFDGVWFVETYANRITHVSSKGTITSIAVPWKHCDPDDLVRWAGRNVFTCESGDVRLGYLSSDGSFRVVDATRGVSGWGTLTVDSQGTLWYADGRHEIAAVNSAFRVSYITVPGTITGMAAAETGVVVWDAPDLKYLHIGPSGLLSEFSSPVAAEPQQEFTTSPAGDVWMGRSGSLKFVKVSANGFNDEVRITPRRVRPPAAAAPPPLGKEAPTPPGTVLRVTTVACQEALSVKPSFRILRMDDRRLPHMFLDGPTSLSKPASGSSKQLAPGVWVTDIPIVGGNYEIYAGAAGCSGQVMAAVLPGHNRATSIALTTSIIEMNAVFDHDHAALGGTINVPGATLRLVDPAGSYQGRALQYADGAFYADSLQRRPWVLQVLDPDGSVAQFPIDLTGAAAGDFYELHLSASDVSKRLKYHGTLFSRPEALAVDPGGVWYTNPERSTVGFVKSDGERVEFAAGANSKPFQIVADGHGGAWFTDMHLHRVAHVTAAGRISGIALPGNSAGYSVGIFMFGGSLFAIDSDAKSVYRILPRGIAEIVPVPQNLQLHKCAFDPQGRLWLNVTDKSSLAYFDGSRFRIVQNVQAVPVTDALKVVGPFLDAALPYPDGDRFELLSVSRARARLEDPFYAALRDGSRFWLSDCRNHRIVEISDGRIAYEHRMGRACAEGMAADGNGGVWFRPSGSGDVIHVAPASNPTTFHVSGGGIPIYLTVDNSGTLWFIESGTNRIGFVEDGAMHDIDLGNPGATPHLRLLTSNRGR